MKKYEILDHKADLKIKGFGKTKKELLENILFGMNEWLKPETTKTQTKRKIEISSPDFSFLLVDFLNELLYLSQTKKEVYFKVNFQTLTNTSIKGEVLGKKVKRFGEEIKAATYHDLKVFKNKKGMWEAVVLFDI